MKFHTIYESVVNNKAKPMYVLLTSHGLEGRCCFVILTANNKSIVITHAMNTILENISDAVYKCGISDIILGTITKETGSIGLEWAVEYSSPMWMSEDDFKSNFKEVTDESRLPTMYQDYLKMMRD